MRATRSALNRAMNRARGSRLEGDEPAADEENVAALADFIARELPTVERWDLLAYTNLGQPKYRRLDQ